MDDVRYQFLLSWDDLHLFLEVARSGTLTGAAMRIKLSQPTASRRLRALETSVGHALFERTAAGLKLTEYGEAMVVHAERMEEGAIALERHLVGTDRGLEGGIRVACPEWLGRIALAEPVARFVATHPFVTVEMIAEDGRIELESKGAELAMRFQRFQDPDVVQRRLGQLRYGVFAARTYLDIAGHPKTSNDGDGHRLVVIQAATESMEDVAWMRRRWPRARFSVRSNSADIQARACQQGAGLAILPLIVGQQLDLAQVEMDDQPPQREIWVGHHHEVRRLARVRAFIDYLEETVAGEI
jgi:DNA-binding transcriptional LysR family regulator